MAIRVTIWKIALKQANKTISRYSSADETMNNKNGKDDGKILTMTNGNILNLSRFVSLQLQQ